jgi:hypothetical protein
MKKISPNTDMPTVAAANAAEMLAEAIGGSAQHWAIWLKNDRRPGRANRVPPVPGPGRPRYYRHHIEEYILELKRVKPEVRERVEHQPDVDAPILNMAVALDDAQLDGELAGAKTKSGPIDLVAFDVLAGDDQHGQPTIWIRSGLRGGMHLAITLPFTSEEVQAAAEKQQW